MDREAHLRANIAAIAEDVFPDDTGLEWKILGIEPHGDLSAVTVEPSGNVGYPRFVFLVDFSGTNPESVATYALQGAVFGLLCTSPNLKIKASKNWPPQ